MAKPPPSLWVMLLVPIAFCVVVTVVLLLDASFRGGMVLR